jgi:hypothetical protein
MDLTALQATLSTYGTVEYCGYNGGNTNELIISITGFSNTVSNIDSFNSYISINVAPEFPSVQHFGLDLGILKAVYTK